VAEVLPFAEIEKLPAELQGVARECNAIAEKMMADIFDLLPQAAEMTSVEANHTINGIVGESTQAVFARLEATVPSEELPEVWARMWDGTGYMDTVLRIEASIYASQENWRWAAARSGWANDWDTEVYYLRKTGFEGYATIVCRTYERIRNSVAERMCGPRNYRERYYDF
jgi:hypothetical protein